jgi:2-methylisocitrate lyase-like PEP mutase family enzyme
MSHFQWQEVIRRCNAFVEAGADVIQPSRLTPDELKTLRQEMPNVPISAGKSLKMAKEVGTQIVAPSSLAPLLVAMRAVMDYYQAFMDTGEGEETDLPPETRELRSRFMEIIGLPKYWEIEAASTEKGAHKTQHADTDPSFYRKSR